MIKRALSAAAVFCTLVAGTASVNAGDTLTASDIRNLFPGSFQGVVHGVMQVTITASSNGRLRGEMGGDTDTGRWRVRNGQLCMKWSEWTEGKYVCSPVTHYGGWFHANSGGPIRFRKL